MISTLYRLLTSIRQPLLKPPFFCVLKEEQFSLEIFLCNAGHLAVLGIELEVKARLILADD